MSQFCVDGFPATRDAVIPVPRGTSTKADDRLDPNVIHPVEWFTVKERVPSFGSARFDRVYVIVHQPNGTHDASSASSPRSWAVVHVTRSPEVVAKISSLRLLSDLTNRSTQN